MLPAGPRGAVARLLLLTGRPGEFSVFPSVGVAAFSAGLAAIGSRLAADGPRDGDQDQRLTATAAANGYQQRPTTAHNLPHDPRQLGICPA